MSDAGMTRQFERSDDQQTLWSRETATDLVERLAASLRARWRAGERISIERLGGVFPRVAEDSERLLDLIYHELLVREEFGERPTVEIFAARFPQLEDRIRRLLEIHRLVEQEDERLPHVSSDQLSSGQKAIGDSLSDASGSRGSESRGSESRGSESGGSEPRAADVSQASDPSASSAGPQLRIPLLPEAPLDFELLHELGRGAMAVVYKARQISLNRVIALKMLATARGASVDLLGRLRQEAQAVAQLHHPNVVQIFEVGYVHEQPYLVLEYVSGGTLQRWLDGRPIASTRAARLIETLARAAHYAHRRGIVHRDLKPANILLAPLDAADTRDGVELPDESALAFASTSGAEIDDFCPKISDFGLAKATQSESDLTVTGQVLGTPSYMSPEQAAGKGELISSLSDIYSLGALLYQLLTGRPPFIGSSMLDVLDQVRGQDPVPPRRIQPTVSKDLETICLRCLEKSPERRYESAEHLADDLRRYLDHVPIHARPTRPWERAWKWMYRRPLVASLMAACALLLAAGVAGVTLQTLRVHQLAQQAQDERDHARRLHREAVAQMQLAIAAREDAETNAQLAARRAEESRRNFQRAFAAVDGIRQLGSQNFRRPDRTDVGRELLDFTLQYYEGFVQDQFENPEVQEAAQQAFLNAGDIASALGDRKQAAISFQRAIDLGMQRAAESPQDANIVGVLANSWRRLGNARRRLYQYTEAENAYQSAIDCYRQACGLTDDNERYRVLSANSRLNLALTFRLRRQFSKATEQYSRAEEELTEVLSGSADVRNIAELATCLDDHGRLLWQHGMPERAAQKLEKACDQRQRIFAVTPADPQTRQLYARSHISLALLCRARQEWEAGEVHCQQALELLQRLAEEFPTRLDMRQEFPSSLTQAALLAVDSGNSQLAEQRFRDTWKLLEEMVEQFPEDLATVRSLGMCEYTLGEFYWEQGRWQEAHELFARARATFGRMGESWPDSSISSASLAWFLATCPAAEFQQFEWATELTETALAHDSTDATHWSLLGLVRYRAGDFSRAAKSATKAIELCDGSERFDFLVLGLSQARLGETDLALSSLQTFERQPVHRTHWGDFSVRRFLAETQAARDSWMSPAPSACASRCVD